MEISVPATAVMGGGAHSKGLAAIPSLFRCFQAPPSCLLASRCWRWQSPLPSMFQDCEPGVPTPGSFCWIFLSQVMFPVFPVWFVLHPLCWELGRSSQSAKSCLLAWDSFLSYFLCFLFPFWTYH